MRCSREIPESGLMLTLNLQPGQAAQPSIASALASGRGGVPPTGTNNEKPWNALREPVRRFATRALSRAALLESGPASSVLHESSDLRTTDSATTSGSRVALLFELQPLVARQATNASTTVGIFTKFEISER